ncbi:endonuclease [Mesonia sp.]|uniref:endonuclease n=1 Tax=Mesonia sp. TaxID=1960830 RepID=UPI00176D1331|nr:endonuclease [Mesonia sp.]HIB37123.1 T9SS type A sorting domain-containing protein [Mesonia sp.]HIO26557.1 T9SS type A sorting domain-containing protein [Flavobacteriaceae bacterium]
MKKSLLLFVLSICTFAVKAQVPAGYYNSAQGLSGYALKSELSTIITNGHTAQSYGDLWDAYYTSDIDDYYENDGTILDIYSENPTNSDPYNFTLGSDQCGNYNGEGSCYNREHLFPKSWFDDQYPMYTDIHHIYPTDGYVNGQRGNFPFGEVGNASWTSQNGTKKGNNIYSYPNAYNGTVFEPIDEFKGDVARVYFYMATRYESQIDNWDSNSTNSDIALNGTTTQVYEDWFLDMLLQWHNADPVSQKEIDRNNEAYIFQGNRNPYIDNPQYVAEVWTPNLSTEDLNTLTYSIYPNPSQGRFNISLPSKAEFSYAIYDLNGRLLQQKEKSTSQISVENLASGLYLLRVSSAGKTAIKKLVIE